MNTLVDKLMFSIFTIQEESHKIDLLSIQIDKYEKTLFCKTNYFAGI